MMSNSMNRATLIGNLGADPEIRSTQSGDRVANFSVATSERWTDKQTGEIKELTEWHRITTWNQGLIDKVIEPHLHKGMKVMVEGALRTRKWTDQAGVERYSTEIQLGNRDSKILMLGSPNGTSNGSQREAPSNGNPNFGPSDGPFDDSEVPF